MSQLESTVNPQEINKFAQYARFWWDTEGPLKTLHDINATRLDFILQQHPLKNVRVLDVGCGGGVLSEAMAKVGAKVTGIDAEEDAISVAKEHAKNHHRNIDYFCSSIEHYRNDQFDIITCMELLEHVDNPNLILKHCQRLLKPNGFLFISTINRTLKAYACAVVGAEYLLNLLPRQTHDYSKFIKPSEMMAMARTYGLQLVNMKGMDYNPLLRTASLGTNVTINYLMSLQRT